jgi:hypothetical protein
MLQAKMPYLIVSELAYIKYTSGYSSQTVEALTDSDLRLKKEVVTLKDSPKYSAFFDLLKPSRFRFNQDNKLRTGLIAQEVLEAEKQIFAKEELPALVSQNNETGYYSLNYIDLIAINIAETQKLKQQVKDLQSQINLLKNKDNKDLC